MFHFWNGFYSPVRAILLIVRSPRLISLISIPLLINIGLYILFFHYGNQTISQLISHASTWLGAELPAWLASVSVWFLKFLGWVVLIVVAALMFTLISGIICAPFNDILCRTTVKIYQTQTGLNFNAQSINHSAGSVIKLELKRTLVLLGGGIVVLVIGVIPFLQIAAYVLGAWLLAFEYFGYPISQKSIKLFAVARFTLGRPIISLGFGSALLLLMAIPFASIIYIPISVVSGALLYCEAQAASRR